MLERCAAAGLLAARVLATVTLLALCADRAQGQERLLAGADIEGGGRID